MGHACGKALKHVAAVADGSPADPTWRVTLHFHPDRLTTGGMPILEGIAGDGVYRSQFETGTSNGGLTAYPGGDRWRWESRIFGGAYDDSPPASRPKYGSLNFRRRGVGGSARPRTTSRRSSGSGTTWPASAPLSFGPEQVPHDPSVRVPHG
jgi:hypothetical protein